MSRVVGLLCAGIAAGALLVAIPQAAEAHPKCALVKGKGWGLLEEGAKRRAKWALNDALARGGWKAKGHEHYDCKREFIKHVCLAEQKACK